MNLIESLALLARSKAADLLGGAGVETTAQAKTAQVEKLLADAERRIARLLAQQKKTQAKSAELAQEVKTDQSAISQAEQEVDAALRAGDDELARARLTRAKAMRLQAEAEESRLRANEKMAAQIEEEIAALQNQMKLARERFADAASAPPAQAPSAQPPQTAEPKNKLQDKPAAPAPPEIVLTEDQSSLADALRKLQEKK